MKRIADLLPIVAVLFDGWRPIGYCLGWGTPQAAHLERFVLRPGHRAYRNLVRLIALWDRACVRRGALFTTVRIGDMNHPRGLDLSTLLRRDRWTKMYKPHYFTSSTDWYFRAVRNR